MHRLHTRVAAVVAILAALLHLDPTTNAVVARFSLPDAGGIAMGQDALWVVNTRAGSVWRITPP